MGGFKHLLAKLARFDGAYLRFTGNVRSAPPGALIVADGTSCRHQIEDGAQRGAVHVARVLAAALG